MDAVHATRLMAVPLHHCEYVYQSQDTANHLMILFCTVLIDQGGDGQEGLDGRRAQKRMRGKVPSLASCHTSHLQMLVSHGMLAGLVCW